MKARNNSAYALIAVLLLIILFLYFYFLNKMTENENNQKSLFQYAAILSEKEDFLLSNFDLNYQMTGLLAPELFCMITNTKGCQLSEMSKEKPVLIYRYTNKSCEECYIDALTELEKEIQNEVLENRDFVKILCSHETERELMILRRTYKFSVPIYRIPSDAFSWVAEESHKPYYFVLHPNMKISHIYVPDREFPDMNKQYLEAVKRFSLE